MRQRATSISAAQPTEESIAPNDHASLCEPKITCIEKSEKKKHNEKVCMSVCMYTCVHVHARVCICMYDYHIAEAIKPLAPFEKR